MRGTQSAVAKPTESESVVAVLSGRTAGCTKPSGLAAVAVSVGTGEPQAAAEINTGTTETETDAASITAAGTETVTRTRRGTETGAGIVSRIVTGSAAQGKRTGKATESGIERGSVNLKLARQKSLLCRDLQHHLWLRMEHQPRATKQVLLLPKLRCVPAVAAT